MRSKYQIRKLPDASIHRTMNKSILAGPTIAALFFQGCGYYPRLKLHAYSSDLAIGCNQRVTSCGWTLFLSNQGTERRIVIMTRL